MLKQPIKIEKPFKCLLMFSSSTGEGKILQTVLLSFFFSVFIFSMPSKWIIVVIQFMFLGINIFWTLLRAHFNPCLTAQAKMSLSRAQTTFMAVIVNSIVLIFVFTSTKITRCTSTLVSSVYCTPLVMKTLP